jgi:hypothetical protein
MPAFLRVSLVAFLATTAAAGAQTFNGNLAATDATRDSGQYIDTYTFQAAAFQMVRIAMTGDFDTYLIVKSPSGMVSENDDAAGGSLLDLITTEGGTWTITATSYNSGETGDYEIIVTAGRVGQAEVTEGRLDRSDQQAIKGEYFDEHTVNLGPGSEYYIELSSLGFDGYLSVISPSGQATRNDDFGSTELARVGPITGQSGEWKVYVTSVSGDEVGAYDLRIVSFPQATAPAGAEPATPRGGEAPQQNAPDGPRPVN